MNTSHAYSIRSTFAALALLVALTGSATAQTSPAARWELVVPSGGVIPTGAQRQSLAHGSLTSVQVFRALSPALAATASLGWNRSRDLAAAGDNALDIVSLDLGGELRGARRTLGRGVTFSPFAGMGAGARHANHRHLAIDARNQATAYLSAGGELGVRRVRVRLEARDYVSAARPFALQHAGNDVALLAGVRWVSR